MSRRRGRGRTNNGGIGGVSYDSPPNFKNRHASGLSIKPARTLALKPSKFLAANPSRAVSMNQMLDEHSLVTKVILGLSAECSRRACRAVCHIYFRKRAIVTRLLSVF